MKWTSILLAMISFLLGGVAQGAGFAHNENFLVLAADQRLADEVLAQASKLRGGIIGEWLGEEWLRKPLDPECGRTILHVKLSDTEDEGLTWAVDYEGRRHHRTWVTAPRERAFGSTLRHELVHCTLSTRFGHALPKWAEEGAACLSDDGDRKETRQRLIEQYRRTGRWPDLEPIVQADVISRQDEAAYASAASLTEFLVSRADKPTFLNFAVATKAQGWSVALQEYYGVSGIDRLQAQWRSWANRGERALTALPRRNAAGVASIDR